MGSAAGIIPEPPLLSLTHFSGAGEHDRGLRMTLTSSLSRLVLDASSYRPLLAVRTLGCNWLCFRHDVHTHKGWRTYSIRVAVSLGN